MMKVKGEEQTKKQFSFWIKHLPNSEMLQDKNISEETAYYIYKSGFNKGWWLKKSLYLSFNFIFNKSKIKALETKIEQLEQELAEIKWNEAITN